VSLLSRQGPNGSRVNWGRHAGRRAVAWGRHRQAPGAPMEFYPTARRPSASSAS